MPHQTEPSANNALGGLLHGMLSRRQVLSENTQTIAGNPGLRPDILITAAGCSPVVVESEYMPAAHAEAEAKSRLGLEVAVNGRVIEAAIALRYPEEVGDAEDLAVALKYARLSYCAFTEEAGGVNRFPASGWLDGTAEDLADLIRLVSLPQRAVDEATTTLQEGISGAAKHLDEVNDSRPAITAAIARLLGMTNVPQTRRMACAIIANAMVFHERIAGIHEKIKPLSMVCGDAAPNPQGEVLAAWTDILDVNYWAIFAIAKDILEQLPSADAANILRRLRDTAQSVNATGVDNAHDLDRPHLPAADRRPQVPGDVLHAAGVGGAAGPAGGGEDGRHRLVGSRGDRPAEGGRLRLRDRRVAVGGVRPSCRPSRAGRRRSGRAAPADDGGGAVRFRRDALGDPHHRLDAVRGGAVGGIRKLAAVHDALRPAGGQQREDRLAGAAAIVDGADAVQHERPGDADGQRRRGDGGADNCGDPGRGLRPGDNESAIYSERNARRRIC